jgi:hypothetical protein
VPEAEHFKKHFISMGYVDWRPRKEKGMPFFVILAKLLPIFVSIFRLLDRPYAKNFFPDRGAIRGGWRGGKAGFEVALLKSRQNDSDLYTSLVMPAAIEG